MSTLTIQKDSLTSVARKAESLTTMLSDVEQDYFGTTNFKDTIVFDADRLRRYIGTCFDIAHALTTELHENGIWCYDKEVVA